MGQIRMEDNPVFTFTFTTKENQSTLTAPIPIPLKHSIDDYVGRLMSAHNLPCFVQNDLRSQLLSFVNKEETSYHDRKAEEAIAKVRDGKVDIDKLVNSWAKAYAEETLEFAKPEVISNDAVFSEVYHALIHSPALESLLNLEHEYSLKVEKLTKQKTNDIQNLQDRQRVEMEEAVKQIGIRFSDEQINQLAQRHFENIQLTESKWASELSNLHETQKREYRDWVMKVHEDSTNTESTPAYLQKVRALSTSISTEEPQHGSLIQRREESFTVYLGSQLKTMHNMRLLSCHILDFCRHRPNQVGGKIVPQPQRLQTAMGLYSNSLHGLVLMVDNRINSYTGIKKDFADVCEQSTDFHFPTLEQQFETIESAASQASVWRSQRKKRGDGEGIPHSGSSDEIKEDKIVRAKTGDFYITRHSNLAEVHTVFHLVADDTVRSHVSEISSQHPVIIGIKNILKCCFRYDVHTIAIPLLLVHEMSEEMTIAWCMKRAELVLKCVKGFMVELVTWNSQDSRTIQFVLPRGISDETFAQIGNMMQALFMMSNPIQAK